MLLFDYIQNQYDKKKKKCNFPGVSKESQNGSILVLG